MKKLSFLLLLLACVGQAMAESVNGINYMFDTWSFDHPMAWVMENMSGKKEYSGDFVIPDSVTKNGKTYPVEGIRREAFNRNPNGITSMTLPKTMKYIEGEVFHSCSNLKKVYITDLAAWCNIQFNYRDGSMYSNPLSVADTLFVNGEALTDLVVPMGVKTVKSYCFQDYKLLKSVVFTDSVETIEANAFYRCINLTNVTFNDSIRVISGFSGCTGLTDITFPEEVEQIGGFDACTGLTSITLPDKANITGSAFSSCTNLTNIIIGEEAESIGSSAFTNCESLLEITIPKNIKNIDGNIFTNCNNLQKVIFKPQHCESTKTLGMAALPNLTEFEFGEEVEYIPDNLCSGLKHIQSITIPQSVTHIGTKSFYQCDNLQSIVIPDNVIEMCESAFEECKQLQKVSLGNGLTIVPENAFKNCTGLKTLTLGNGVKTLKANAFYGAEGLENIYNYRLTPGVIYSTTFDGVDKYSCNLVVPEQALNLYLNASGWMEFYSLKKMAAAQTVETPNQDVVVNSQTDNATITWLGVQFAVSYQFVIRDLFGRAICTLLFNVQGQLTGIKFAPQRNKETMNGLQFTVTGLTEDTEYTYDISAIDSQNEVIEEYTGSFKTQSNIPSAIDLVGYDATGVRKVIKDGKVLIVMPYGKQYNATGVEVR